MVKEFNNHGEIQFEPLSDYILLEQIAAGETPGGIALPEGSDMGLPKGRVIKVGPGKMCEYDGKQMPMYIKPGDLVYLMSDNARAGAFEFTEGGKKLQVVRQHYLMGFVKRAS